MPEYVIHSWFNQEDDEVLDFDEKFVKETKIVCSEEFLGGIMLVGPLILPAPIEDTIKVFRLENKEENKEEIENIQSLGPQDLDDCKYPEFEDAKFDEERFNNQLNINRQAVVGENGYDLFLNYDNGGTTHLRFENSDVLRGIRWGMKFFDEEDGTDYCISALYQNGIKIENPNTYIDELNEDNSK
jgi:hypothetical protein